MSAWLDTLAGSLQLARPEGTLLLCRDAWEWALQPLLKRLLPEHPDLRVVDGLAGLAAVPDGAVVILIPQHDDLDQLNLRRSLLRRRRLRVILWCWKELGELLRLRAPDFTDWILRGVDAPSGPAPYAVEGLRALRQAGVIGCRWRWDSYLPTQLSAALGELLPGARLTEISAALPYGELVKALEGAPPGPLCFSDVDRPARLRRVRWALAQRRSREPALVLDPAGPDLAGADQGLWTLPGGMLLQGEATAILSDAARPLVLWGLLGADYEATFLCADLLRSGYPEAQLIDKLRVVPDSAAELARLGAAAGLVDLESVALGTAAPPLLRGLWDHPAVRARCVSLTSLVTLETSEAPTQEPTGPSSWYQAEPLLRGVDLLKLATDAPARRWLVACALAAGEVGVASAWAGHPAQLPRRQRPRGPWQVAPAEEAVRRAEAEWGPDHPRVADALEQLAEVYRLTSQGAPAAPEALRRRLWRSQRTDILRRAMVIREEHQPPRDPEIGRVAAELAAALFESGWWIDAPAYAPELLLERALVCFGADPRLGHERAGVLALQGRWQTMDHSAVPAAEGALRAAVAHTARLRILALSPHIASSVAEVQVLTRIQALARMRRLLEDGSLTGDVALEALLTTDGWGHPRLLDPQILLLWQQPATWITFGLGPLSSLLSRLGGALACLCVPAGSAEDVAWWRELLPRDLVTLITWPTTSFPEVALAFFCEAIALGQSPNEAVTTTTARLGEDCGLRVCSAANNPPPVC